MNPRAAALAAAGALCVGGGVIIRAGVRGESVATALAAETSAAAPEAGDPLERQLARASITSLRPRGELSAGLFDASVSIPGRASEESALLSIALIDDPYAHRRPLAFYRLARALGAHVVPASAARRVGAGELGALLAGQPLLLSFLRARASIQNDGTIDALLTAPGPAGGVSSFAALGGREIAINGAPEIATWAAWARSLEPAAGESTPLVRDYVEMLVLDYLSANVIRRAAVLDEAAGSLVLADNATAFPLHADPRALDPILSRLRECARFPRGLRDKLARFDRTAAAAALAPGSFDTWLVSPRSLVTLDERRAGLLTLIEAKMAEAAEGSLATPPAARPEGAEPPGEAAAERAVLSL